MSLSCEHKWGHRIFMQEEKPIYRLGINADSHGNGFTFMAWASGESSPTTSSNLSRYEAEELALAILETLGGQCINTQQIAALAEKFK